jgi:hypothetical protein
VTSVNTIAICRDSDRSADNPDLDGTVDATTSREQSIASQCGLAGAFSEVAAWKATAQKRRRPRP